MLHVSAGGTCAGTTASLHTPLAKVLSRISFRTRLFASSSEIARAARAIHVSFCIRHPPPSPGQFAHATSSLLVPTAGNRRVSRTLSRAKIIATDRKPYATEPLHTGRNATRFSDRRGKSFYAFHGVGVFVPSRCIPRESLFADYYVVVMIRSGCRKKKIWNYIKQCNSSKPVRLSIRLTSIL